MAVVGVMVVAAIGGVALLMKSNSDKAKAKAKADEEALSLARVQFDEVQEQMIDPTPIIAAYTPPKRKINIGPASGLGAYKWFGINSNSRSKADISLEIGDQGMINNKIPCTVSDFWIDSNGKRGAFKCEGMDYYEVPNGSRFEW